MESDYGQFSHYCNNDDFERLLFLFQAAYEVGKSVQPPSGGCVLKRVMVKVMVLVMIQPPTGGCVLKQIPAQTLD